MNTRRDFIKKLALTACSASVLSSLSSNSFAASNTLSPALAKSRQKLTDWIVIDDLGGIFDMNTFDEPPQTESLLLSARERSDVLASGISCIRMTAGSTFPAFPGDNLLEKAVANLGFYSKWLHANADFMVLVRSAEDIVRAKAQNKIGITLGFQNSHMLGNNLDRVDIFRDLGVLTMQLTYNGQNQLGGGANVSGRLPLTSFGHSAIEKMNDSKVIIDLSHSGERTCLDAIKASKSPVTISHAGCRALADFPRNKTDEEMKLLADKGGLFGLYFMPFLAPDSRATGEHLIAHIEHAINICGEDHVSIGTDGSYIGVDDMDKVRKLTSEFTQGRIDKGVAAAGEKLGNVNFLPDMVGPTMFADLALRLSKRGHNDSVIEKVLGANSLRLMKAVW